MVELPRFDLICDPAAFHCAATFAVVFFVSASTALSVAATVDFTLAMPPFTPVAKPMPNCVPVRVPAARDCDPAWEKNDCRSANACDESSLIPA